MACPYGPPFSAVRSLPRIDGKPITPKPCIFNVSNLDGATALAPEPGSPDAPGTYYSSRIRAGQRGGTPGWRAGFLRSGLRRRTAANTAISSNSAFPIFSWRSSRKRLRVRVYVVARPIAQASGAFHEGHTEVGEIQTAYYRLAPCSASRRQVCSLFPYLCPEFRSSVVGTMAGQVIMQRFVPHHQLAGAQRCRYQ
jgi:manganese transport protein